ncbi:MAG: DUF3160 domain-containing protein, partial [Candidatus Cloacimonadota bacterium]
GKPFTAIEAQIGIVRGFPRGLDVMAVLGSNDALTILKKEGDASYEGYDKQMKLLSDEFSQFSKKTWRKNLYFRTLYLFKKMIDNSNEFTNPYLKKRAWTKKILNTLLGAWAELRHDTILYAKQSYTIGVTSVPPSLPTKTPPAYIEAYPSLYTENRILISALIELLEQEKVVPDDVIRNLRNFNDILKKLIEISVLENKSQTLDKSTTEYIRSLPDQLKGVVSFPPYIMDAISDGTDSKMAVIADVHTDTNTKRVLEVGVGKPFKILIVVPINNEPYLMEGATFSFYEFKQELSKRLTDEEWQTMIENRELPPLQQWFLEFNK